MYGKAFGHFAVNGAQERQELLMAVLRQTRADHRAGEHIECGEQGGGAVAFVVMSHRLGTALDHRQRGLGRVQGLHRQGRQVLRKAPDLGQEISGSEHDGQHSQVIIPGNFLADVTEWGWPDTPTRRLVFRGDIPRLPQPLPRYLPVDADRRLTEALHASPNTLAASALLLLQQRACGLRWGTARPRTGLRARNTHTRNEPSRV